MSEESRDLSQSPDTEPLGPRGSLPDEVGTPAASFYTTALDSSGNENLVRAKGVEGLNEEIAVLRIRLHRLLDKAKADPDHDYDPSIFRSIELLVRAVAAKSRISRGSPEQMEEGIDNILRNVGLKLGLDRIPWNEGF